MSKLIHLRHRIKAIETIKKITHAMRLIAMSTYSQLKTSQDPLAAYTDNIQKTFNELLEGNPNWQSPILYPDKKKSTKALLIIIGSQKGLCGSFNTNLFKLCSEHILKTSYRPTTLEIIAVGQKAIEFVNQIGPFEIKHSYESYNASRLETISNELVHAIMSAQTPYQSVLIASNHFKSFFVQKPKISQLIPVASQSEKNTLSSDLTWQESPEQLLNALLSQYLYSHLYFNLFQSLYAEHAARFVSMDGATRNAESILEATKLEYNKLRQAKITKELTELTGSFS